MTTEDERLATRLGCRLNLTGYLGTVKYVGEVNGTNGIWLGVEWDDPQRGKHDGKGYFICQVPNAGSFIRPSINTIIWGCSLVQALEAKYLEVLHDSQSPETVVLGSSNGSIEVEAVRFDHVRRKLSQLDRLREISLDMQNISSIDGHGNIAKRIPNVQTLDLSRNLFTSWSCIQEVLVQLSSLCTLALNGNRLQTVIQPPFSIPFHNIRCLYMNTTLVTWNQMANLFSSFPRLEVLEVGYNRISSTLASTPVKRHTTLRHLNFDSNHLTSWPDLFTGLESFPGLQRLILTGNQISHIPIPSMYSTSIHESILYISLSSNRLASYIDVQNLFKWAPRMESLNITKNPLLESTSFGSSSRQLVVAMLPTLKMLNGSAISREERNDCERFYLSYILKQTPGQSDEQRLLQHPRWMELCGEHGRPDNQVCEEDILRKRLIEVTLVLVSEAPNKSPLQQRMKTSTTKVIPTIASNVLRMTAIKALRLPRKSILRLWILLPNEGNQTFIEIDPNGENRTLESWGIEQETSIFVSIE